MQCHGIRLGRATPLAALALSLLGAPAAAQQHWVPSRKAVRSPAGHLPQRVTPPRVVLGTIAGLGSEPAQGVSRSESESNNTSATANAVALGDTISGIIDPEYDLDYFALELTAGSIVEFDVDANQFGSPLDPYMAVFGPTGTQLGFQYDTDGFDPRIRIGVATTGLHVVGIASEYGGGPDYTYKLRISELPPPPGDPTSIFASGLGAPWGIASDDGNLYIADRLGKRLLRVSSTGVVSTLATLPIVPLDVVIDGYGDLLVAGYDTTTFAGAVRRVTKGGTVTPFISGIIGFAGALTVGPDGDIWVADSDSSLLRRYDSQGVPKGTASLGGAYGALDLAFSPTGVLHLSDWDGSVFKLVGTALQPVIFYANASGLAFDQDGYLYASAYARNEVALYSPAYQLVGSVFAFGNLDGPFNIGFARNADGTMSSRLYATNAGTGPSTSPGTVVLLNAAGIRAPGHRIGTDLLRITTAALRAGIMGETYADTVRLAEGLSGASWSVASGTLPPGITLNATTGVLAGVLRAQGKYTFSVQANAAGKFGIRSYTIEVTEPTVAIASAASHLLGAIGTLTPDLERYLDLQGNANGRFDVGDLRAYLRKRNELKSSANPAQAKEATP